MALNPFSLLRPIAVTDTGTFSRTATATYYDKNGYRATAAANVPRFTYDPITKVPQGGLLEAAATNRVLQSNTFTNASWTKNSCTVVDNASLGADNTTSMGSITASAGTAHYVTQSVVVSGTGARSVSLDFKNAGTGTCTHMQIFLDDGAGANGTSVIVRLADGVVTRAAVNGGNTTGATASVRALQNGVFRVTLSGTIVGTTVRGLAMMLDTANAAAGNLSVPSIAFTTSDLLYISAFQIEDGTTSTSYIPTTTVAVTRDADVNTAMMLSSVAEVAGTSDPAAWAAGTAYTLGQQASRIVAGGIHKVYQRLIAGTTATAPESDAVNWVYVSPTNRWKAFDAANETQTANTDDIQMVIQPGVLCDSIAFDNLDADTIRVFVQGTTFDQTIQLKTRSVANWFQYFFEPFKFKKSAVFTGIPLVTTNVIHVIIRKAALTAKVGTCIPTLQRTIGYAEPGAQIGIIDYSTKSTDQFGSTTVVQRSFSKRMTMGVMCDNADVDAIEELLALYRATPVVWVGAGNAFTSMVVYGYYKSFDIDIVYPTQSRCNIEIEGLT